MSEPGLHLDSDMLHGVLSFPNAKTNCQLQGFLGLVGYCQNWIPNFSLMAKPLYVLLNNNNPDPSLWEEPDEGCKLQCLKGEFDESTCPWASKLSEFLFPFCIFKGRECPWGNHSQTQDHP